MCDISWRKIQQDATIYQNFYSSIFLWSSTCFGRHTAHHQEPKTALAASGFSYVKGCWTCSWWTLSGTVCLTTSTNYRSNNLPRTKNQRLPVQSSAPDDGRCVARNMLSFIKIWNNKKIWYIVAFCWIFLYELFYDARIHDHHVNVWHHAWEKSSLWRWGEGGDSLLF